VARISGAGVFVGLALAWGLSFPAIAVGLEYFPPFIFAAIRYGSGAVILLAYAGLTTNSWVPTGGENVRAIAFGGPLFFGANGLLFVAQQTVPSGVAAIMQGLAPILTALWAFLLLDERISPVGTVGIIVSFLGLGLIVRPDPGNLVAGNITARLILVTQVLLMSLGGVLIQRSGPSLDRIPLTGWSMLVGSGVLVLLSVVAVESPVSVGDISPMAIGAVLYLVVVSTVIAFTLYYTLLSDYGAFEASLIAYLVPVVSTIVGVWFLDETIRVLTFVGFGLVFVGFALLKRRVLARYGEFFTL